MTRLEKPSRRMATLGLVGAAVAGCQAGTPVTASTTPKLDQEGLARDMAEIGRRAAPGRLGVGLMNLENGEVFTVEGNRPFPMQSVFKLPLGAYALSEVDAGRLRLNEPFRIDEQDLSPFWSPISRAWPARRDYTAKDLILAAVAESDNTAADVLMKRVGGPGAVTAWLQSKRIDEVRVDRYERELQPELYGMPSFRPEWRDPAKFHAAFEATPPAVRMQAMRAYLSDPRDTATPEGMLAFLHQLDEEQLISPGSTRFLMTILFGTTRGAARIPAGLPKGARAAHKIGTSGGDQGLAPATNDVGIIVLPDRRAYALAVFLAGSTADLPHREALIADVARAAVKGVG
jgi:beta-lactamase class A